MLIFKNIRIFVVDDLEDIEIYRRKNPSEDDDDISQYARQPQFNNEEQNIAPKPEQTGLRGVYSDAKDIVKGIPSALVSGAIAAPGEIAKFGGQAAALPYENLRFIMQTLMHGYKPENLPRLTKNLVKGVVSDINIPSELVDYAGKKEFIPKDLGEYIRLKQPATGLKPEDESVIAQSLPLSGLPAVKAYEAIHPTMHLRNAKRLVNERDVGSLRVPTNLINESKQFLPKNEPTKNLLAKAKQGNYNDLFTLQSDLYKRGNSLKKSLSGADRNHGFDAHNLRSRIIDEMRENLAKQGHQDIADLMKRGQGNYRRYKKAQPYALGALGLLLGQNPIKYGINKLFPND